MRLLSLAPQASASTKFRHLHTLVRFSRHLTAEARNKPAKTRFACSPGSPYYSSTPALLRKGALSCAGLALAACSVLRLATWREKRTRRVLLKRETGVLLVFVRGGLLPITVGIAFRRRGVVSGRNDLNLRLETRRLPTGLCAPRFSSLPRAGPLDHRVACATGTHYPEPN